MVRYTLSKTTHELQAILDLQQANLAKSISKEEALEQGFVTVVHDLSLLEKMNSPYPHTIAIDDDEVVGYAMVMLKELGNDIPVLVPMFDLINEIEYKGKALKDTNYMVMGQVCVAKTHRGQGIFRGLYNAMQEHLKGHFDYIVTEIAQRNTRSIRAHEKVGFETIKQYHAEGEDWVIVLLQIDNG